MPQPTKLPLWDINQTATSDPGTAREDDGWNAPAGVPEKPPYQTFNHWMNNVYLWLKYMNEQGVPEWDTAITYAIGAYVVATDNKLYRALISQAGNTPVADPTNWKPVGDLINTLVSTDETRGLTAAQGKILKDVQDSIVSSLNAATEISQGIIFLPKPIIMSNGADADNDIDTEAGNFQFADGSGSANIGAFTKQIDNIWSQGTNQGGRAASVSLTVDTWYHYFALSNADGSAVDFGFDTDINAANLIADAAVVSALGASAKYSLIESVLTGNPANIKAFQHVGDIMLFSTPVLNFSGSSSVSAILQIISSPLGRIVEAMMNARGESDLITYLSSPGVADSAPSTTIAPLGSFGGSSTSHNQVRCLTDTSSQIRRRSVSVDTLRIVTYGWRKI